MLKAQPKSQRPSKVAVSLFYFRRLNKQASKQIPLSVRLHRCERSELIAMICLPRKCHRISLVYFKGERRGKSEAGLRQSVPGGTSQRTGEPRAFWPFHARRKKKKKHTRPQVSLCSPGCDTGQGFFNLLPSSAGPAAARPWAPRRPQRPARPRR